MKARLAFAREKVTEFVDGFATTEFGCVQSYGSRCVHPPIRPERRLWANPDCGLKTRGEVEVIASLRNLVAAARAGR